MNKFKFLFVLSFSIYLSSCNTNNNLIPDTSEQALNLKATTNSYTTKGIKEDVINSFRALIRAQIVVTANSKIGSFSGQSNIDNSVVPTYKTDISGGDGQRIRDAISIFIKSGRKLNNTVKKDMSKKLSTYNSSDSSKIISRIASIFGNDKITPSSDEEVLQALFIQQQCKEFVDRIVKISGGFPKKYDSSVVSKKDALKGMLAFKNDNSHATIIVNVIKDEKGNVVSFDVVDSNFASDFSNPVGDIPWERKVRKHNVSASKYKVIDPTIN